jgi:quercetin dioxygenase-like cupin family protein
MAFAGQVLANPISGERITFRKTAADTDGKLLVIDLELSPAGHVPGAHVHPLQEERFEIMEGMMKFRKGLRTIRARAGDTVVVTAGTVHRFENAGEGPAHVRVHVQPALRMEDLFETAVALARDGRTTARGMPYPLELALFMREFDAEVRAPFVPAAFLRLVMAPLEWLARRRGLNARYQKPATRSPLSRRDSRRPPTRSPEPKRDSTTRPDRKEGKTCLNQSGNSAGS